MSIEDNRDPGYEPRSVVITFTVTIDATIADCDDADDTIRDMRATLSHATRNLPGCNEISIEVEGAGHAYDDLLAATTWSRNTAEKIGQQVRGAIAKAKALDAKGGAP